MSKNTYLNNAITQYIDLNGKCRILNFDNVSIAVSPLPVLNIQQVPKSETHFATISDALDFVKVANLRIKSKEMDESRNITGLWVESINSGSDTETQYSQMHTGMVIAYGYIPIEDDTQNDELSDIPSETETIIDPIFVETYSILRNARLNEKVAELLKEYALFEWAQSPEKFGKNTFTIFKDRTAEQYGITDQKQNLNFSERWKSNFYHRSKIIVPDEKTMINLISYVKVMSLNDSFLQHTYKLKTRVNEQPLYKSITDFRPAKDQFIFIDKGSLVSWLAHNASTGADEINVIQTMLIPHASSPYYYRNNVIKDGRLAMIQNTRNGDLLSALIVSKEWVLSGANIGYEADHYMKNSGVHVDDDEPLEVYTVEGLTHSSSKCEHVKKCYSIIGYDSGEYGALLFL